MILPQKFCFEYFKMYIEEGSGHSYQIYNLEKGMSIDQSINANNINMIYVDEKLLKHVQTPLNIPGNWTRFDKPGCGEYVLVRKDIL